MRDRLMAHCDDCRRLVEVDYPHSCYWACRGCGDPIDPAEDYCGACRAKEGADERMQP